MLRSLIFSVSIVTSSYTSAQTTAFSFNNVILDNADRGSCWYEDISAGTAEDYHLLTPFALDLAGTYRALERVGREPVINACAHAIETLGSGVRWLWTNTGGFLYNAALRCDLNLANHNRERSGEMMRTSWTGLVASFQDLQALAGGTVILSENNAQGTAEYIFALNRPYGTNYRCPQMPDKPE